jgi:hypothetical protein
MTTNDFDRDKVLARVKKMMALANNDGATEGERDTAMHHVYTILAKYNLSLGEIESPSELDEARDEQTGESHGGPWVRTVCHAIAELCFCRYFYTRTATGRTRHHFIGRTANSTTAREMAMFVYTSIERESKQRYPHDTPARTSFAKGAAVRVHHRCAKLRKDEEERAAAAAAPSTTPAPGTGTALVLASLYRTEREANDAYIVDALKLKLRSTPDRQQRTVNAGAYHAGQSYGDSVSLHRQVGTKKATQRLR